MMAFFNKKKDGNCNMLEDNYVPCSLPSFPPGLELFIASNYSANDSDYLEVCYETAEKNLDAVIATADHHFNGEEIDFHVDTQMKHVIARHDAEIARNNHQLLQIRDCILMRKQYLDQKILSLEEGAQKLETKIEPLKDLRPQFRLGPVSVGILITAAAMVVDALCNYGFLQNILLSNAVLLMITVICMSIMSDASMWAVGTLLSHRNEDFMPKNLFRVTCIGLVVMFALSVVASVMIRFGSMAQTYGLINTAGEFVGKKSYSIAEYGVTLVTAFLTTGTGILSFAFSYDENDHLVTVRQKLEKDLASKTAELEILRNERSLLEEAPDPSVRDTEMREAARHQLEALQIGLKALMRKKLTLLINEPSFTEKMAGSGKGLIEGEFPRDHTSGNSEADSTPSFHKVS